jgi:murein DD-endopeptidase
MSTYTNTLKQYRISDGWEDHLARGSGGGIDYAVGMNTPILAPCDGQLENRPMTNGYGNYIRFHHGNGFVDEYLHLNSFVGEANYKQGDIIGYSGSTGNSTGPHIHWHLIDPNGRRVNPLNYVDGGASMNVSNDKADVQKMLKEQGLYSGTVDGIPGKLTWTAIQTWLNNYGLYDGVIDGIPGPKTYSGFQLYGKKNDNYRGALDGILGVHSWAGFAQTLREDIAANLKAAEDAKKAAAAKPVEKPVTVPEKPVAKPVIKPAAKPAAQPIKEKPVKATITKEQFAAVNAQDDSGEAAQHDLVSLGFWNYAGERVIKTFAMTASAILTTTGAVVVTSPDTANVFAEIGWGYMGAVAAVSALNSLLVALSSFKNIVTVKKDG